MSLNLDLSDISKQTKAQSEQGKGPIFFENLFHRL
jgi:hypothetical protein